MKINEKEAGVGPFLKRFNSLEKAKAKSKFDLPRLTSRKSSLLRGPLLLSIFFFVKVSPTSFRFDELHQPDKFPRNDGCLVITDLTFLTETGS